MRPRTRTTVALAASALVALPSLGMARPDRYKREYPVQTLAVTGTESEVGMEYQYFEETSSSNGSGRVRYKNHYLQEYFRGKIKGYAYHPRFVTYSTELTLGLAQQRLRRSDSSGTDRTEENDTLIGYDVRVELFKEHPVSATLLARRDERILMGLFVDRFLVETETESATVRWRRRDGQMDLTATHTDIEEYGVASHSKTSTDSVEYNWMHHVGDRMRTDLQYRWQAYDRRFRADTFSGDIDNESELESQDLNLSNRINLGSNRNSYLRSTLRIHDQENNQDLRTYHWQERLQIEHAENLRSYLTGGVQRNETSSRTVDTYRAEAGIDHELFRSLKSHLDLHGRHTDYGEVDEDRYGVTGRLNYRKTTALGVLSAGYTRTFDQVEREGDTASELIIDEAVSMSSAFPQFLSESDVEEESIIVTDTSNNITYTEGFDYEIETQGQRTGLQLIPGGLLAEGDTVFVDYRVEVDGDSSYLADDEEMFVRHDFDRLVRGLSLYARRRQLRARDVDMIDDDEVLEYTDEMAGLRQELGEFAFTTEFQQYEDNDGGFDQWRNQVEGSHSLGHRLNWGWNAGYNQTVYDTDFGSDDDDESDYLFAGVHLDGTFGRSGFWKIEGRTMEETGRTERTTNGILARAGFQWRRMTVEGGARYEEHNVFDSDQERAQLFIRMSRKLGREPVRERPR